MPKWLACFFLGHQWRQIDRLPVAPNMACRRCGKVVRVGW